MILPCLKMSEEINKESVILELTENEMISISEICRLCANQSDKLVPIFSEEGIANELDTKINLYLPIKVAETDELPLQCCWGCASTILAWHELVEASVEADRRLRSYQFVDANKLGNSEYDASETLVLDEPIEENVTDKEGPDEVSTTSLNAFCQTQSSSELDEYKSEKITSPVYFASDPSNAADNFDTYITTLQHPFMVGTTLHQAQNIISFKEDELDEKITSEQDLYTFTQNSSESNVEAPKTVDTSDLKPQIYNFACHLCPSLFMLKDDILKHYKDDHPNENIQDNDELKDMLIASTKKEKRKHSKIDQALINEAKVCVEGKVYYNCKQCGKSLHSPYTYVWHIRIHTGERPYVCDLCGKQFRVSQGLIRHVRETHEGIKNFPCDLCGRMFATRRNVEEHRRIHTNERPYICDLCGKTFKQKASLFVHNRSHSDSFPFKCSYCNQRFRTKPPLNLHITRHTGEKPYPCEVCGRRFRIKYELKRHRLIHSDEKPFSCNFCGLNFRQKRYLKNHLKLNHGQVLKSD